MPVLVLVFTSLVVCSVILFIALKDVPRVLWLAKHGRRTTGKIFRDHTVFVKGPIHFPVVRFKDDSGFEHEFQSRYPKKSSWRDHMVDIVVAYDPKNPKNAEVLEGRHFYPFIIQILVFLAIAAGIPAALVLIA